MRNLLKFILPGLMLMLPLSSCKKENNGIPYVAVDLYVYPTDPNFVNLNAVGGWVYITGGSRGIIVYRSSNTDFMAYERHCPFEPDNTCGRVQVDSSNIIIKDPCCGSEFLITDGMVTKGPATLALTRYQTTFDGSVLHIYN